MPASVMMVVSQLFKNQRFSRFMKNITQKSKVITVRPSVNNCATEKDRDSCSTRPATISSGMEVPGEIDERYSNAFFVEPPLITRNRMDSGKNAISRTV